MKMTMDEKSAKEFALDLYLSKRIYSEILQILETFFSGDLAIFDEKLNKCYLLCWTEFEKRIQKHPEFFEEILTTGRPIPSLSPASFPDLDNADEVWEYGGRQGSYRIFDLLEQESLKYTFPPKSSSSESISGNVLQEYIKRKQQEEKHWLENVKKTAQASGLQAHTTRDARFEDGTLYVSLADGSEKAVSFDTHNGRKNMMIVMNVLFQHWRRNGNAALPKAEMQIRLRAKGIGEVTDRLINNTIANIRRAKIAPADLSELVTIAYDATVQGYSLDIKRPSV